MFENLRAWQQKICMPYYYFPKKSVKSAFARTMHVLQDIGIGKINTKKNTPFHKKAQWMFLH